MSWQDAYRRPGTAFGAKGPYYDPIIGHRGRDYYINHEVIPSYLHGVVSFVSHTGGLGGVIGVDSLDGFGRGWAHVADIAVGVGDEVWPGTTLGRPAGWGDPVRDRGVLWAGEHIHTTKAAGAYAAAVGNTPLWDPSADIAAAISGTAPAGGDWETIEEGFLMALSDEQQEQAYKWLDQIRKLIETTEWSRDGVRLIQVQTEHGKPGGWYLVNVDPNSAQYGKRREIGPGRLSLMQQYLRGEEVNSIQLDQVLAEIKTVLV